LPYPHAAQNDVIVRVHAAGFTPGELDWPATWTDRAGDIGRRVFNQVTELTNRTWRPDSC
jgi:hypothetical protein